MKALVFIWFFLFGINLFSQSELNDTIKLNEVIIIPESSESSSLQKISENVLNAPGNSNLAELVGKHSPIFVKSYGIGSLATVSMRGTGSNHTNVIWNGISLNSSMSGIVDFSLFPTFFFDEAMIQYGTSSLENASGGIGGAVLLESTIPNKKKSPLTFVQKIGSFGLKTSQISLNSNYKRWYSSSKFYFKEAINNFSFRDISEQGFPEKDLENSSLKQQSIKQDFYFKKSENSTYGIQFWYFNSERNLPTIFTVNNQNENQVDQSLRILLSSSNYIGKTKLDFNTAVIKDEIDYENKLANINSNSKTWASKSVVKILHEFKEIKWSSVVNLDFNKADQEAYSGTLMQNKISLFNQVSTDLLKQIKVSLSARKELIFNEDFFLLPAFDFKYKLNNKPYHISYKLGKNLKFPSLNDLYWIPGGNPELKAETSFGQELGVIFNHSIFNKRMKLKSRVNVFQFNIENYILWRPNRLGYWEALNLKQVKSKGLELSIEQELKLKRIQILNYFNYSFTKSVGVGKEHEFDNSAGKQLIYVPEHKYNLMSELRYKSYWINYNLQFIGARYTTSDNAEFLPYYMISDISIGKKILFNRHYFELSTSVQNLFDTEYQAIQWRPMPGRNYLLNLKYRINEK